jgi:YaeC family lipoprotein
MANVQNFKIKKRNNLAWIIAGLIVLGVALGAFFYIKASKPDKVVFGETLKIHFEPAEAGEERILKYINEHIAPDYGIKIEGVGIQDSSLGNGAVASGELAASIYQHELWLREVIEANGFELSAVFPIFQWGFGIYSDKHTSADDLPNGALVAIPVDGGNQAQALWLLEREGFIKLNGERQNAKIKDIVHNPRNLKFKEFDFLALPRVLDSVDIAVGYVSNFDAGKIPRSKGLLFPKAPRIFACQLVIGTKFLDDPQIKKLIQTFKDPRLREYLETTDDPLVQGIYTPVSDS